MLAQIYYYSTTQQEFDSLNAKEGDILPAISVPTPGNFLRGLNSNDDILLTLGVNIVADNNLGAKTKDINVSLINAQINSIQGLTPLTITEVLSRYNEDPTVNNGVILDWAFKQGYRSILIQYFDGFPELKKHIERLLYSNIKRNDKVWLMKAIIDRYDYDITVDNYRLFTQAAMCKNATLCEYLLDEKDARIPENVFNAFMTFGTKRFQHMWDLLKRYKDRVIQS